ncbi:hypothetical protein LZ554_003577 [Drepanopeziza brunnea f. sp. 'monogermtubi']|nr:hypothetical protein LZ554_003577 [Drepanopeziza brunnea f. sp. 'monogermtubi']
MGRSSKFNFPIPGRKRKDATPALVPPPPVGGSLSKAQRILGTTSDFTTGTSQIPEEDHPRRLLGSTSGGMTISISDSSVGSIREQEPRHHEPEALSRNHVLNQKASSATLLRTPHLEDGITATSDRSRPLTNKDSSSTLRSGYDRRKIQLSISQQTSASSARDMALRKGYPSPAQRSPLLDEVSLDQLDDQFGVVNKQPNEMPCFDSSEVPERKKKLHLSTLFTKSRKAGEKPPDSGYVSPNLSSSSADGSRRATFFPEVARPFVQGSHRIRPTKHIPILTIIMTIRLHRLFTWIKYRNLESWVVSTHETAPRTAKIMPLQWLIPFLKRRNMPSQD